MPASPGRGDPSTSEHREPGARPGPVLPSTNSRGGRRPAWRPSRKGNGKEAKLSYNGNLLIENRNGLIVNTEVFPANGMAERAAAMAMLEQVPGERRVTVGADKGYDTRDFVAECRHLHVTPHVAQNTKRSGGSAIDARTTRHGGYAVSQKKRKRIEECFGWMKTIALMRKVRHRGIERVGWVFTFATAAYNLCGCGICWPARLVPHESGEKCARTRQSGQHEPQIEALTHFQNKLGCSCLRFG